MAFCTNCGRENTITAGSGRAICDFCLKPVTYQGEIDCPHCAELIDIEYLFSVGPNTNNGLRCGACGGVIANAIPIPPIVQDSPTEGFQLTGVTTQRALGTSLPTERAEKAFQTAYASWVRESLDMNRKFRGDSASDAAFRLEYEALLQQSDSTEVANAVYVRHCTLMGRMQTGTDIFIEKCALKFGGLDSYGFVRLDRFEELVPEFLSSASSALRVRFENASIEEVVRRFPAAEVYSEQWVVDQLRDQLHWYHANRKHSVSSSEIVGLSGHEFEAYLEQRLRKSGFASARKTKGSGDQGADLVLSFDNRKIVIQAKRYSKPVPLSAVQEVHFARIAYGATEAWIVTNSTITPQALVGANVADVRVVDRSTLQYLELALRTGITDPVRLAELSTENHSCAPAPSPIASTQSTVAQSILGAIFGRGSSQSAITQNRSPLPQPSLPARVGRFPLPTPVGGSHATHSTGTTLGASLFSAYRSRFLTFALVVIAGVAVLHFAALQAAETGTRATLERWVSSMKACDATEQASCYAPRVERFFRDSNVPNSAVLAAKQSMFAEYPTIMKYELTNIRFERKGWFETVVTFDKAWDARGSRAFAGSEKQRLTLVGGPMSSWKISAEDELEIYWVRRGK